MCLCKNSKFNNHAKIEFSNILLKLSEIIFSLLYPSMFNLYMHGNCEVAYQNIKKYLVANYKFNFTHDLKKSNDPCNYMKHGNIFNQLENH